MRRNSHLTAWALSFAAAVCAADRRVAITIDDLPRGGDGPATFEEVRSITRQLLTPFRKERIPVIGFVNEGRARMTPAELRNILGMWLDSGADLGNHTYSHPDLNQTEVAEFEKDLVRGEAITRPLLRKRGKDLVYFRHPFLHVGLDLPERREAEAMLARRGYTVAPVTIDNSDYLFASAYGAALRAADSSTAKRIEAEYVPYMESLFQFFEQRAVEVVGKDIPQILLLHANELNAREMPRLLAMMRSRGYRFITLREALEDPAYSLPDTYAGKGGFSWIHHWSITKGMPGRGEPDEPAWLRAVSRR